MVKPEINEKLSELQTSFIPEILEWFSENVEKCVSDASLCPMLVRLMKHDNHVMKGEENLLVTLQAAIAKKVESKLVWMIDNIFLDCTTWIYNRWKSSFGTKTFHYDSETDLIKWYRARWTICQTDCWTLFKWNDQLA